MIYFLTEWQSEDLHLESDIVFNVNKVFYEGGIKTQIINTQASPFLNYFTNPFEFYDSYHFIELLDSVTERFALNYAPITIGDLQFPKDWEKVYTRANVLLSKDGNIKAEVFFNSFGFVSQVHYHTDLGKEIHIYSEKGTILNKQFINYLGEKKEQQFFDEGEQLILTQWNDYVFIGEAYQKKFKQTTYQTFNEVCMELINVALKNFNPKEDRLIVDGTSEWLMSLVKEFNYPESIVYLFSGSTQFCISQVKEHLELIKKGKLIVTDNILLQKELEKKRASFSIHNELHLMPFYATTLALGKSNHYSEQFVYWQVGRVDSRVNDLLKSFLQVKLTSREFCFIIEVKGEKDLLKLDTLITKFISQNFEISFTSSEYGLAKQYFEALKNNELTAGLREIFQTRKQESPEFSRVIEAYLFYTGFSFRKNSRVQNIKEDFQKVRLYIDGRETFEFLTHTLAVSVGIPVLSKIPSPYLVSGKNGCVYQDDKQLLKAVMNYLNDSDQWNKNLVESVEIIEANDSAELLEDWKEKLG